MPVILAVDLGKTSCRAALWVDEVRQHENVRSGAPGLAERNGAAVTLSTIRSTVSGLPTSTATHVVVGAAGALALPTEAARLGDALRAAFPGTHVAVTSDAVTSHAGALGGAPGVVLAAGTGAVAVGISVAGSVHVVDGAGPWLGDEGSGAWIGLAGLRAAQRATDRRGKSTALLGAAEQRFGDLAALPGRLGYGSEAAQTVAAFAPDVVRCAELGDQVADQIVAEAAAALAASTLAAARALSDNGPVSVAVLGGLTRIGNSLWSSWSREVSSARPRVEIRPARGDALAGARLLATTTSLPHEDLVQRWRATTEPDAT